MRRVLILSGLAVTLMVLAAHILDPQGLRRVEAALFDQYQRWAPRPYDPETPVRIIDIDEESLARYGQWPWPRHYMAEMARRLEVLQAGAVGYDILFAEPDRTSPERVLQSWSRFGGTEVDLDTAKLRDHDTVLAEALARIPAVLSISGAITDEGTTQVAAKAGVSFVGDDPTPALDTYDAALVNLPGLTAAATGIGQISLGAGSGQTVREVPLVAVVAGKLFPALSVEMLRVAQGAGGYTLKTTGAQNEARGGEDVRTVSLRVGALVAPLTGEGAIRIHFSGPQAERTIPAWRLLQGDTVDLALAEQITGRLILIGSSAQSLRDIRPSPLGEPIPGMEIHAEVLEQIIAQSFLYRPDIARGLESLGILIFGGLMTVLMFFQRPWIGPVALTILCGGAFAGTWIAFRDYGLLLDPIFPAAAAAGTYVTMTGLGIFLKEQERRAIRHQFAHFIPPELIQRISDDPDEQLTPSGAERELSVMFIDIRSFSTITEKMDPETVVAFVNDFLTPLSDMILDRGGTIDKFIGDAVMAFWNAPTVNEDHAAAAVQALLDMPDVIAGINDRFQTRGLPAISAGAGVNTGTCSVGFMGSRRRLGYTTIGDAVNLASRLEGLTKPYGAMNCIGESTAELVRDRYAVLELDVVAVKGRTQPERVHTVIGPASSYQDPAFLQLRDQLEAARAAYTAGDWDAADAAFATLGTDPVGSLNPGRLARTFTDRIDQFRVSPPPRQWGGVYVATEK